jgi:hypothetical protein
VTVHDHEVEGRGRHGPIIVAPDGFGESCRS